MENVAVFIIIAVFIPFDIYIIVRHIRDMLKKDDGLAHLPEIKKEVKKENPITQKGYSSNSILSMTGSGDNHGVSGASGWTGPDGRGESGAFPSRLTFNYDLPEDDHE